MAEKSSFESIMNEITGGLTGNYDADLQYLEEQGQKYKDHEQAKEILYRQHNQSERAVRHVNYNFDAKYYLEIVSAFADLDEVNEMLRRIMET